MSKKIAVVGGGAGGFFAAINGKIKHPNYDITIFEKGKNLLGKVKISGGGRCNVTHACFEPKELVKFYPRGQKELLGPFHTFMTGDTMEWFESRGVSLKIEEDNRIFPITDDSQTIIDCLLSECENLGVNIATSSKVENIQPFDDRVELEINGTVSFFDKVIIAAGGNAKDIWSNLEELGYIIEEPIPSLFTFNTKDTRLRGLSGVAVPNANVRIAGEKKLSEYGPLLITHWGMSGPAILKLSSVGARKLAEKDYKFNILVDWCLDFDRESVFEQFEVYRAQNPKRTVLKSVSFNLPKRIWESLVLHSDIPHQKTWAELGGKQQNKLVENIKNAQFQITGKSTNKDEFVTCGGVNSKQVDFTKFQSKLHPNIHFVGEVLDIDALTGGFNFQAAWTGGYITACNL